MSDVERTSVRLVGIEGQDYGDADLSYPLPQYATIAGKFFVREMDTEYYLPVYKEVGVPRLFNSSWAELAEIERRWDTGENG